MGNNIYNYDLLLVINSEGVANEKNYSDGDARRRYTNLLQSNSHLSRSLNTHQDYVTTKKTGHNFIQHILFHHTLSIWAVTSTHPKTARHKIYSPAGSPHRPAGKRLFLLFCCVFSKQRQDLSYCCPFSNHDCRISFLEHGIAVRGNNRIPVTTNCNN